MERGLPKLLVSGRSFRRHDHSPGASRCTLAVVSRAPLAQIEAFRKRMGWRFHWVSSFGCGFNYDYQVSFTEGCAKGKVNYNYDLGEFPSERRPGQCLLQGIKAGEISTPIRLTRAGLIFWSVRTTFSTWRRKAATKMAWPLRCHGFAITIGTVKATSSMRRNSTRPLRVPMWCLVEGAQVRGRGAMGKKKRE